MNQFISNITKVGLKYPAPKVPNELPKKRTDKTVKYISNGACYNKYYNLVEQQDIDKKLEILQTPLPNPKDFQEFKEYEEALFKWEELITDALKEIELPDTSSTLYFRPKVSKTIDELQIEADFDTQVDLDLKMMEDSEMIETNEDELTLTESE